MIFIRSFFAFDMVFYNNFDRHGFISAPVFSLF